MVLVEIYSKTSELWTPWDHAEMSITGRCPFNVQSAPGNVTTLSSCRMLCV